MIEVDLKKVKNPMARGIIIENTRPTFEMARARIRLDCKAPSQFDEIDLGGVCKPCDLRFAIRFSPVMTGKGYETKIKMASPFLLKCNMLVPKGQCRIKGYEDLMESDNPILIWIRENTCVCEDTFTTALENPYLWIPFCLNYGEYAKKTGTFVMTDYRINNPYNPGGKGE